MPSFLPVEVFKGGLLLCLGCCNPESLVGVSGVSASLRLPPRSWEFAASCLLTDLTLGGPCKPPVVTAKARAAVWKGTPDEAIPVPGWEERLPRAALTGMLQGCSGKVVSASFLHRQVSAKCVVHTLTLGGAFMPEAQEALELKHSLRDSAAGLALQTFSSS